MPRPVVRRPRARLDIAEIYEYFWERNPRVAERWLDSLEETLNRVIAEHPFIGAPKSYGRKSLRGLRMHGVRRFRAFLIFYRVIEGTVVVICVLRGSRDIPALLV